MMQFLRMLVTAVILILGTTIAAPGRSYGRLAAFEKASLFGAVGEASHLYLYPRGVYFHPQYNDVTGDTDKLLTTSMKIGVLDVLSDGWSYEVGYFWRFLTPAFKSSFREGLLERPVGVYADWMEVEVAVSKSNYIGSWLIRQQLSIGGNHIGNKGAKKIHRWVHEVTKNSLEGLEYNDQPAGYFATVGGSIAAAHEVWKAGHQALSAQMQIGAESSKMMDEFFIGTTAFWSIRSGWWDMAFDLRLIRQVGSDVYSDLKPFRYEGSAGAALYGSYTPMIKYVSSYLRGDDVGQTYFDFLHFNFTW